MNTPRRGDEAEARVLPALMDRGPSVSVPFGDSDRYDLVADDGDELYRVQCKTGSRVNGTVRFKLYSSTVNGGDRVDTGYSTDEVDAYAVAAPDDTVYWVDIAESERGEMRLRVEEPHPKARSRPSTGPQTSNSVNGSTDGVRVALSSRLERTTAKPPRSDPRTNGCPDW
ncbi:group I intron-associated PD-(D/E)XK endonuclease [Halomarina litorea]|uniref:group I intron-associated PD-(D/E)XK endonuclease n=1 Tax=Halomarina litorea TaxID=2961595 RepID=UPI0020C32108|nr:group I intron-associated PD-(D/E)XK endonuclease [Halomarina sp. BCD28]